VTSFGNGSLLALLLFPLSFIVSLDSCELFARPFTVEHETGMASSLTAASSSHFVPPLQTFSRLLGIDSSLFFPIGNASFLSAALAALPCPAQRLDDSKPTNSRVPTLIASLLAGEGEGVNILVSESP